jgi:hypothetical protein
MSRGTATDWAAVIDATWGPSNLSAIQRWNIYNDFWNTVDQDFACFQDLVVDWDAIHARYVDEILSADISKGRFHAIMNQLALALRESHTFITDDTVANTALGPGVPLLVYGGWGGLNRHFAAGLTPLPDKSLLVYEAVDTHPLGLKPGDVVLGYEGRPWSQLYQELIDAELPMIDYWWWGSSDSSFEHSWLMSGGMNWHLFNTIDILKRDTGEIQRLSTSALDGADTFIRAFEQLPVSGVSFPALSAQQAVSHGIVEGTQIGYIYVQFWGWDAQQEFFDAVWDLAVVQQTDGLIIDFRTNYGGTLWLSNDALEVLFDTTVWTVGFAERCDPVDHLAMCQGPSGQPETYVINGDPSTYYDKPIAVLVGPGAVSSGDHNALRLKFHPEARFFGKSTATAFNAPTTMSLETGWSARYASFDAYLVSDPDNYLTHDEFEVDCPVWFTPDDVASGTDTVVQTAIDWILGTQADSDGDTVGNPCDNCPELANEMQIDTDLDGAGDVCDCAPLDSRRYPAAVEINDGIDNQCPGAQGSGLVDEIVAQSGFRNLSDRNEFSWFAQPGGTAYEVARSDQPDFSAGCWLNTTSLNYWVDTEVPADGAVFHYLVRAVSPNAGSWGTNHLGVERASCP